MHKNIYHNILDPLAKTKAIILGKMADFKDISCYDLAWQCYSDEYIEILLRN